MEPIEYNDSSMSERIMELYNEIIKDNNISSFKSNSNEIEVSSDVNFEKLKVLLGEAFAMGVQIGIEKSRFGSEEAYKQWVKGKPQEHIEDMLNEIVTKIMKLFEDSNKSLIKTPVKPKNKPLKDYDYYKQFNYYKEFINYGKTWELPNYYKEYKL